MTRISQKVAGFPLASRLTQVELDKTYQGQFVAGWEFPQLVIDPDLTLRLLLPKGLPFSPPRIAVHPAPKILTWPHLEENGILCLLPDAVPVTTEDVDVLAFDLLSKGQTLVNNCLAGVGFEQFEDEFSSYWLKWQNSTSKVIVSLCHPGGPSRWVSSWHGKLKTVIAEDDATLRSWLKSHWGGDLSSNPTFQQIPLLKLIRPLHPSEYPRTIDMILTQSELFNPEGMALFRKALADNRFLHRTALLEAPSRYGPVYATLHLAPPIQAKKLSKGFRDKEHVPAQVLVDRQRCLSVQGAFVNRCDAAWIHGRDHNQQLPLLAGKRVMVLGGGSIGSGVAELLAKAGVGRLDIVDPEILCPENCSRHSLGLASLYSYKAVSQAIELEKKLPHLTINGHKMKWEQMYEENPDCFDGLDLIISTIGSWKAESRLNVLLTSELAAPPPVIYGWTEPHAAAGHAVAFFGGKGCLRCILTDKGRTLIPVTNWSTTKTGTTMRMTPLCGGEFQPYGAIELSHIQALIADLGLDVLLGRVQQHTHHVWIGRKKLLDADAGEWNDEWITRHGDPGNGGCLVDVEFKFNPTCGVCVHETAGVSGGEAE